MSGVMYVLTEQLQAWSAGLTCVTAVIVTGAALVLTWGGWASGRSVDVPGPPWLLGFGPLMSFARFIWMGVPVAAAHYGARYGDFVRVWIAGERTYVITRPSAAWHVLKSNNYCRRFGSRTGLSTIGMYQNGIIWNGDDGWRVLRGFFQKALNADTLNRATSAAVDATYRQMGNIAVLQQKTADGKIEALDFLRRITLEVTNNLTLGVHIADPDDLVERIVRYFKAWEFFLLRPPIMYLMTPKLYWKHCQAVNDLNDAIAELLTNKRQELKTVPPSDKPDFATCLLQAEERGEVSPAHVQQCVLEMLLAGTDTSSVSMYYLLVSVAENPQVELKVLEEMRDILGERDPTKADLPQLVYLEQVIKEAMRIKPVGPVIMRQAKEDDRIDGIETPAGTNIILNLADMHRRQDNFPAPDDFNPQHFDNKDFKGEYVPFGTGPKGCIGQFLAMIEMKAIMCTLLRKYHLRAIPGESLEGIETHWDIAQQPVNASYMYFEERN
ncbi:aromatase-like [Branchiostoma floridae]|uniref:aromatase n=1 Tax=Branchiostoma floridae TaxID=7739 RepID=A0A9J7KZG8_BRAFL|nr:aromatase-like [Branchiostoma floridae]